MNRRRFLTATATAVSGFAALPATGASLSPNEANASGEKGIPTKKYKLTPPSNGSIPVAIVISDGVNIIDFSGPWGVFDSVMLPHTGDGMGPMPFDVFSVSEKTEVVSAGGLKLLPGYTFASMPAPKVVVIPAQQGSDSMIEWLRKVAPSTDVTMSVCTGAFKLAKAGLLSGKAATTHHEFLDKLQEAYPDIQVKTRRQICRGRENFDGGRADFRNRSRASRRRALFRTRGRAEDCCIYGVPGTRLDCLIASKQRAAVG